MNAALVPVCAHYPFLSLAGGMPGHHMINARKGRGIGQIGCVRKHEGSVWEGGLRDCALYHVIACHAGYHMISPQPNSTNESIPVPFTNNYVPWGFLYHKNYMSTALPKLVI